MEVEDHRMEEDPIRSNVKHRKGRGFQDDRQGDAIKNDNEAIYESIHQEGSGTAQKSIEGWIILVSHVHEEATEEDVMDKFAEFGDIKNLHLNLDRRTGYVKGYALIEYNDYDEAKNAIEQADGSELLGQAISCNWAFVRGPGGSISEQVARKRVDRRNNN